MNYLTIDNRCYRLISTMIDHKFGNCFLKLNFFISKWERNERIIGREHERGIEMRRGKYRHHLTTNYQTSSMNF